MDFQSLIDFNGWTFIAQICNLFLQIYLFKRFLFKPVKDIIAKRQAEVNAVYEEADAALKEAVDAKENYESRMTSIREEADAITSRAVASAQMRSEQLLKAAEQDAAALREKASRDIALERSKAMSEAKNEISGLAVEIASKVVGHEIDEAQHDALIAGFIDELGDAQ